MKNFLVYLSWIVAMLIAYLAIKAHLSIIRYQCERVIEKEVSHSALKCFNEGC